MSKQSSDTYDDKNSHSSIIAWDGNQYEFYDD